MWAASEAIALGHGGIGLVERATGISRSTISRGIRELDAGDAASPDRTRRVGGGRKHVGTQDATLGIVGMKRWLVLRGIVEPRIAHPYPRAHRLPTGRTPGGQPPWKA